MYKYINKYLTAARKSSISCCNKGESLTIRPNFGPSPEPLREALGFGK